MVRMMKKIIPVLLIFLFASCDPGDGIENDEDIVKDRQKVCSGDIEIDTPEQLQKIMKCDIITGAVFFDYTEFTEIILPDLQEVHGNFVFWENPDLAKLSFPELERIDGHFLIWRNDSLQLFTMESLVDVASDFVIWDNTVLETFSADQLKKVGGHFKIFDMEGGNPALESFSLAKLEDVGGDFEISWRHPYDQTFENGDSLISFYTPAVKNIGGSFTLNYNKNLISVEFPDLEKIGGNFEVIENDKIEDFDFLSLSRVGENFIIKKNPNLPLEKVNTLKDQVSKRDGIGEGYIIWGNKD